MNYHPLSYIEPFEEEAAKKFIEENLGFEPPKPNGIQMLVKLYIPIKYAKTTDGKETSILLHDEYASNKRFSSCSGLVIAQGPDCYQHEMFERSGPWCKVGDFVIIPRHEGMQISYRGTPMMIINDNKIGPCIPDPSYVTRD